MEKFWSLKADTPLKSWYQVRSKSPMVGENRWDEKAGLRRDAVRSQVIDALEAQEIKETGNEEG